MGLSLPNSLKPESLAPQSILTMGHVSYYAFGSSTSTPITLSKPYRLTGGFDTNSSLTFCVMTSQKYESQSPEFKNPVSCYFSTGNVKSAFVNTTLYEGDYELVFDFVNSTGRLVTTFNGTGLVPTTTLTIIQTFALALLS